MNKKQLREKIKDLPVSVGIAGLALILGLGERGAAAMSEILAGPSRGIGRSYRRMSELRTFWDYYDELKDLKKNSARTILWRLEQKGLVKKKEGQYKLTVQGFRVVKVFRKKEIKEQPWDGKWRLITFDIPEKKREQRIWLRSQLLVWDYKPIQKSVFIGKQPLEEDLYSEIMARRINHFVRLITVGEIDDDEILKF